MKTIITFLSLAISGLFLPEAMAESTHQATAKLGKSAPVMRTPMYQPPFRGAPNIRVGGGTRGISGVKTTIHVIAPEHVGLTVDDQPVLNWHMSNTNNMKLEVLVIDEEGIEPLLELTLDSSKLKNGMQSLKLSDHGIKLKPGIRYQWSVALIAEKGHRSNDIISSGAIEHRKLKGSIKSKLNKSNSQKDVFIYAQEGYWYDAITELNTLIKKNPNNKIFKQQHAQLLSQVGLSSFK